MRIPCALLFLALTPLLCQGAEKLTIPATNTLLFLKQEHNKAEKAYSQASEALPETPEGEKKSRELWESFDRKQSELFSAAAELVQNQPKSEQALPILEWILTIPRSYYLPGGIAAMKLVTAYQAANPGVGKIAAWVGYYTPHNGAEARPAALALIEAVAETNPDRTARAQAVMARAWEARKKFEGDESDATAKEAETAFELVLKDYADCPRLMRIRRPLGEEAEQELFALRNLRPGKLAPEITGEDLEGVQFKLSDYRGKVVTLVFWASWCGPCMQMVPEERKLVERMKNKAFVLIGVNGDAVKQDAHKATRKEAMTWRSFWNGRGGPDGPISRGWNVRGWPTVYILDGTGMIRAREVFGQDLERTVVALVAEAEAARK